MDARDIRLKFGGDYTAELEGLPAHECQRLFLDGRHELFCLYFGDLAAATEETELHVTAGGE